MRSLLEKAIVHVLNDDQDKAEALFHRFMVERAREIHETLRQNADIQLNEGWDNEIQEEEYFDNVPDDEEGGDKLAGVEDGGEGDMAMDTDAGGMGAEGEGMDVVDGDDAGLDGDIEDEGFDDQGLEGESEGLEAKLDDIESKMDDLSAEFDRLMSEIGGDNADDLDGDEFGDDDGLEGVEDVSDDSVGDAGMEANEFGDEAGESDDLAGRMEDDMADEQQPEHKMAEDTDEFPDDEMMEDITESVLAELEKVAAPGNSHKEVGSAGKTVGNGDNKVLPNHPVNDRVSQAKPYLVKGGNNDSFERETPPPTKTVQSRRNNDAGVKKLKTVPKGGDGSALINSDFAAKKEGKPIIDGSKKIKT